MTSQLSSNSTLSENPRTCTLVTQLSQKLNQQIVEVAILQIHMAKDLIGLEVLASQSTKK
jgi:hypothetical protein